MSYQKLSIAICAGWLSIASPAFAFHTEDGPTDKNGMAMTDPDEQTDNMVSTQDGVTTMNFDGGNSEDDGMSFSISNFTGSNANEPNNAVRTGDQLYGSSPRTNRWH